MILRAKRVARWFLFTWTIVVCCSAGYLLFMSPRFQHALFFIIILMVSSVSGGKTLFPSWHWLDKYMWLNGRLPGSGKGASYAELGANLIWMTWLVIAMAGMRSPLLAKIMLLALGISTMVTGNYLSRAEPSDRAATRTLWTTSDPEVWRRTHRFKGRLWFGMGLCFCLLTLSPAPLGTVVLIVWVGMLVVLSMPHFYARRLYRRLHPDGDPPDFDARLDVFATRELAHIRARNAAASARRLRVRGVDRVSYPGRSRAGRSRGGNGHGGGR